MSILDNGVGFDISKKYSSASIFGLETLLKRTKFLKGQMKVQYKKDNGTLLEFQFSVA